MTYYIYMIVRNIIVVFNETHFMSVEIIYFITDNIVRVYNFTQLL